MIRRLATPTSSHEQVLIHTLSGWPGFPILQTIPGQVVRCVALPATPSDPIRINNRSGSYSFTWSSSSLITRMAFLLAFPIFLEWPRGWVPIHASPRGTELATRSLAVAPMWQLIYVSDNLATWSGWKQPSPSKNQVLFRSVLGGGLVVGTPTLRPRRYFWPIA